MPRAATRRDTNVGWLQAGWWTIFAVSTVYGVFALAMGVLETLAVVGIADATGRSIPLVFIVHALAGGVVLVCGPLQFSKRLRNRALRVHRTLGRAYVIGVWVSSLAAIRVAIAFDVVPAAKMLFVVLAGLWFGTTMVGLIRIREGDIVSHREWMVRSFALSFFFVTFSLWVPGLALTGLPEEVSYPLGVLLSWGPNLAVAELWIRRRRLQSARADGSGTGLAPQFPTRASADTVGRPHAA